MISHHGMVGVDGVAGARVARFSLNSCTGINSMTVTPKSLRYGIFSISPRYVPGFSDARARVHGQATDVCFINDSLRPGMSEQTVVLPVKVLLSKHAFWHRSGIVCHGTNQVSVWR